jgi:hypothetical protein
MRGPIDLQIEHYFIGLALSAGLLGGQALGSFHGMVTDPSGRAVPDATIALSSGQTVKSDGLGQYQFRNLKPGAYSVRAAAKGFAPFLLETHQVAAGAARTLDIPLVLAMNSEQVTVTDQAKVDVDPSSNASAMVLKGADLDEWSLVVRRRRSLPPPSGGGPLRRPTH